MLKALNSFLGKWVGKKCFNFCAAFLHCIFYEENPHDLQLKLKTKQKLLEFGQVPFHLNSAGLLYADHPQSTTSNIVDYKPRLIFSFESNGTAKS